MYCRDRVESIVCGPLLCLRVASLPHIEAERVEKPPPGKAEFLVCRFDAAEQLRRILDIGSHREGRTYGVEGSSSFARVNESVTGSGAAWVVHPAIGITLRLSVAAVG